MIWYILAGFCLLAQQFGWVKPIETPSWDDLKNIK